MKLQSKLVSFNSSVDDAAAKVISVEFVHDQNS